MLITNDFNSLATPFFVEAQKLPPKVFFLKVSILGGAYHFDSCFFLIVIDSLGDQI